ISSVRLAGLGARMPEFVAPLEAEFRCSVRSLLHTAISDGLLPHNARPLADREADGLIGWVMHRSSVQYFFPFEERFDESCTQPCHQPAADAPQVPSCVWGSRRPCRDRFPSAWLAGLHCAPVAGCDSLAHRSNRARNERLDAPAIGIAGFLRPGAERQA